MSAVDWAQIISALGTFLAALFAAITTCQNHLQIVKNTEERHAMIKPILNISCMNENKLDKKYSFIIHNIGYQRMNSINCIWDGIPKVDLQFNNNKFETMTIALDFSKVEDISEGYQGKVKLIYLDVLNKKYEESFEISIEITKRDEYVYYSLANNLSNIILK